MAELIVSEFVTLDGVMEAPGGEPTHPQTGWTMEFATDEQQYKFDEIVAAESHLLGRDSTQVFGSGVAVHTYRPGH